MGLGEAAVVVGEDGLEFESSEEKMGGESEDFLWFLCIVVGSIWGRGDHEW